MNTPALNPSVNKKLPNLNFDDRPVRKATSRSLSLSDGSGIVRKIEHFLGNDARVHQHLTEGKLIIKALSDQNEKKEVECQLLTKRAEILQNEKEKYSQENSELKKEKDEKEKLISWLRLEQTKLQEQVETCEKDTAEQKRTCAYVEGRIANLDKEIRDLQIDIENLVEQLEGLETDNLDLQRKTEKRKRSFESAVWNYADIKKKYDELHERNSGVEKSLEQQKEQIIGLNSAKKRKIIKWKKRLEEQQEQASRIEKEKGCLEPKQQESQSKGIEQIQFQIQAPNTIFTIDQAKEKQLREKSKDLEFDSLKKELAELKRTLELKRERIIELRRDNTKKDELIKQQATKSSKLALETETLRKDNKLSRANNHELQAALLRMRAGQNNYGIQEERNVDKFQHSPRGSYPNRNSKSKRSFDDFQDARKPYSKWDWTNE
jgi:chromosome segregation ATPase